jgi:DNA helicase-2/ATP-dependent DNA helicase PcrA
LKDLVTFAKDLTITAPDALDKIAYFAQSVMTGVGAADLVKRVKIIKDGRARKDPSAVEGAAIAFVTSPSYEEMATLLEEIGKEGGVRTFRPAVLRACQRALHLCSSDKQISFYDAAVRMREQNRAHGRRRAA